MIENCASMLLFHFYQHLGPLTLPSVEHDGLPTGILAAGRAAAVRLALEAEPAATKPTPNKSRSRQHDNR